MKTTMKTLFAVLVGIGALGFAAANAKPSYHKKPSHCDVVHDHRSHDANYYDYYPHDRYFRAGPYRTSGLSISIRGGNDRYERRDYYGRRNGYRGQRARIVNRETYDTRYRARIVLTEEVVRTRRGPRLVCNVNVRGPQAHYVSDRRVYRIARRECSRGARINVNT